MIRMVCKNIKTPHPTPVDSSNEIILNENYTLRFFFEVFPDPNLEMITFYEGDPSTKIYVYFNVNDNFNDVIFTIIYKNINDFLIEWEIIKFIDSDNTKVDKMLYNQLIYENRNNKIKNILN